MEKAWIPIGLSIFIFLLPTALAAPTSYISETVQADFFPDGSLNGNITRIGTIEVSVGNTQDVMQFIMLNLSANNGTNIQTLLARKNVASSPTTTDDRTQMFLNTTNDPEDVSYQITNVSITPVINMRLDYSNLGTGHDLNGSSIFFFDVTLNLNHTEPLNDSYVFFQAATNTLGINDSMNLTSISTTTGDANISDSDSDGFFDMIEWTGDLVPGVDVTISFRGSIIPDINYNETLLYVNTDYGSLMSTKTDETETFTGITFIDRFSRGPIRQGIEMVNRGGWLVRGLLRNVATGLDYVVSGWRLFRLTDETSFIPLINQTNTTIIYPTNVTYTDFYNSGNVTKHFYAAEFDWEVIWASTDVSSYVESNVVIPRLYQIEAWAGKTVNILDNTNTLRLLEVEDTLTHIGHINLVGNSIAINSSFYHLSASGVHSDWTISDVHVYFDNGTRYEIPAGNYNTTQVDAIPGADGYVYIYIEDLSTLGYRMRQNDDAILTYRLTGTPYSDILNYTQNTISTLWTVSGTPITRSATAETVIPGAQDAPEPEPPPPGGPGGPGGPSIPAPPTLFADIIKVYDELYFVESDTVNITVTDEILDTGDKGVRDINMFIFIPSGGSLDPTRTNIRIFDASADAWIIWEKGVDFTLENRGSTYIGDTEYTEFYIKRIVNDPLDTGFILYNEDKIDINYVTQIPFGTSYLLTRVSGTSYYEDRLIFEDVYLPVRRESELEPLDVTEGEWIQLEAVMNQPVMWRKQFDIFNPNEVAVEHIMESIVFDDVLNVYLKQIAEDPVQLHISKKGDVIAEWSVRLDGGERGRYFIEASTPPVIETTRETDILYFNETTATFAVNATITNFALENYTNISYIFNIETRSIKSINDYFSNLLHEHENGTEIIIPFMEAGESLNLSMIYVQIPPILVTFLDKESYFRNESALFTILVIPSQKEYKPYLEVEIRGPDSDTQTVFADIIETGILEGENEIEFIRLLDLSQLPSGRYSVSTKYNMDFNNILRDKQEFEILEPNIFVTIVPYIIFVIIAIILVVYVLFTRYKRESYEKEMKKIRKDIERL